MIKSDNIHTISMLVANKPGVLIRCAQVFARRGYNIDALVVSPAVNPQFSRMTITAQGDPGTLEQIIKQTSKLIDVIHCSEHSGGINAFSKEYALIKIKHTKTNKSAISELIKKHNSKLIDDTDERLIVEKSGSTEELNELKKDLKKYGIIEMVRSGKLVMAKGKEET